MTKISANQYIEKLESELVDCSSLLSFYRKVTYILLVFLHFANMVLGFTAIRNANSDIAILMLSIFITFSVVCIFQSIFMLIQ